ncbi:MAG: sigma-70 family RNA polymerase sigma factor [Vicinamibacterales bacterium]
MTPEQERHSTELMTRAQGGDARAYAELLVLLTGVIRQYARGRAGDVPWIDDVVQEALLALHRARHTYDPGRPFAPWFYALTSNRFIDVFRRERRVGQREQGSDVLVGPTPSGVSDARSSVDLEAVLRALDALPPKQREVVRALKLGDQSVREVSARLGMSEAAVKVTAHRGYRALRRLLGRDREHHED